MSADFFEFLYALWHEWQTLLTGGTIIAITSTVQALRGKPMPQTIDWLIVGITFILAAFLAWRKEWMQAGRGFCAISPTELVAIFNKWTEINAKVYVKQYLGKRIKVTARLFSLSASGPTAFLSLFSDGGHVQIRAFMWRWKVDPYRPLAAGTLITVEGRIKAITHSGVELGSLEFIKIESEETDASISDKA